MGRPPLGKEAMSDAERQRRHRERVRQVGRSISHIKNRNKRCFELALTVMLSEEGEGLKLIHGLYSFGTLHAWIELPSGQIYDPVADKTMDLPADYKPKRGYTRLKVLRMMDKYRHSGPWVSYRTQTEWGLEKLTPVERAEHDAWVASIPVVKIKIPKKRD
jgi:hypothetical protein